MSIGNYNFDAKQYWDNRLRKTYDLHGVGYLGLGRQYNKWLYKLRKRIFHNRLKHIRGDFGSTTVLDVGCGTGFYVERWKELGVKKIVGIDITSIAVNNLRKKHADSKFYQLDISDEIQSITDMRFDFVSAFDVLFHIVDDERFEKAISNIYSLMKPNSLFFWSDNYLNGNTIRSSHVVYRSIENIEKILRATGFQIVERRPMFYLMNEPVETRSRSMKFLWRVLSSSVSKAEIVGFFVGGFLYPFELLLTSTAIESPTTEMMICKRC